MSDEEFTEEELRNAEEQIQIDYDFGCGYYGARDSNKRLEMIKTVARQSRKQDALKSLVRKVREAQKIESYVQGIWTRDATEAGQNAIQLEAELDEMVKE